MKYLSKYFFAFLVVTTIVACDFKKTNQESEESDRPVFVFTDEDSIAVSALADQYVNYLNAGSFEAAADMLYQVHNDSVVPLGGEERTGYIKAMSSLPSRGFQKKEITLNTDLDNRVRIVMLLTENGDLDNEKDIMNFYLNPVKKNDKWYLTIFDVYAEGVGIYAE